MQPLKKVLTALRREIESSLSDGTGLPPGTRWEAERVVCSLQIVFEKKEQPDGPAELLPAVLEPGEALGDFQSTVSLTVEFGQGGKTAPAARKNKKVASPTPAAETDQPVKTREEEIVGSLSAVFGSPGFDSSARATVFREALAELSPEQTRQTLAALAGDQVVDDPSAQRVRHLLTGVLNSGPFKSVPRGGEILRQLFQEYDVETILRLIEEKWKTQSDWL